MDISNINKIVSRKRLNEDAEKLRDTVSRETAKIIKLKVAQDTAYWDLKEKLHQVEGNYETLKQNMIEVQLQHETVSGQYEEELRLRPETLNKMSSTREICDVLEEYSERLKETLSRCKRDQATLCDAYERSGRMAREAQAKHTRAEQHHAEQLQLLEEKLALTTTHLHQMSNFFTSSKQQLDSELSDTKQKLSDALQLKDELQAASADLRRQLDLKQHELQAKENAVASLQNDIKELLHEFNQQAGDMKNELLKREKDIKEATEANEDLKKALSNQEEFTKGISSQNNYLQDRISALEDEQATATNTLKLAKSEVDNLKEDKKCLNDQIQEFENVIKNKDDLLSKSKEQISDLQSKLRGIEAENEQMLLDLAQAEEEGKRRAARIEELTVSKEQLEKKIADLEDETAKQRESAAQKEAALTASIQQKDKALDESAGTISSLMSDVKAARDARARSDLAVQQMRIDQELERNTARERERKLLKQVEQLERSVRSKDDELSKQMSIILETRAEKERLQSKIEGMQGTIDNIQKELTGRIAPRSVHPPPDHDDNALMCPPAKSSTRPKPSSTKSTEFAAPRYDPKQLDSLIFGLFSDGSNDGDAVDPIALNRCVDALSRGECASLKPQESLRQHSVEPISQGGLKHKPTTDASIWFRPDITVHKISMTLPKSDVTIKERKFFKSKRGRSKN